MFALKQPAPTVVVILIMVFILACQGLPSNQPEPFPTAASSVPDVPNLDSQAAASIVLVGRPDRFMDQAAQTIQYESGHTTLINQDTSAADLVLFFVHTPDGPMPQTRDEIDKLIGGTLARAAILFSGTEVVNDSDLVGLVESEVRSLLGGYMGTDQAFRLQVLDINDPGLIDQINALINYQAPNLVMANPPTPPPPPAASIILLGMSEQGSLEEAAQSIESQSGYGTEANTETSAAELVLFTINAPDGPMPRTRDAIENLSGKTIRRAAILLIHVDQMNDPELLQLVELEIRQLLGNYMDPYYAEQMPLLRDNDPELTYKIQDIINSPALNIAMSNQPTPEPAPAANTISLIGRPDVSLDQAAQSIENQSGYAAVVNSNAAAADLVLFTVSAPDGPMPQTVEEFEKLRGTSISHAAILFTNVDQMNDPELLQLVELEVRELLARYMESTIAQQLPLLYDNDPDLINKFQDLFSNAPSLYVPLE